MNDRKLKQLFTSAQKHRVPGAPEGFEADVLRLIRNVPLVRFESVPDQLVRWFPRLAFAACSSIVLFLAVDLVLSAFQLPGISDGLAQLSNDWLLIGNGLSL